MIVAIESENKKIIENIKAENRNMCVRIYQKYSRNYVAVYGIALFYK